MFWAECAIDGNGRLDGRHFEGWRDEQAWLDRFEQAGYPSPGLVCEVELEANGWSVSERVIGPWRQWWDWNEAYTWRQATLVEVLAMLPFELGNKAVVAHRRAQGKAETAAVANRSRSDQLRAEFREVFS